MERERIRYNNLTMVLYIMVDVLKRSGRMDMVRMAVLTAMLQDDVIVELLTGKNENLNFANFRMLNKNMMVNINKRFYHTLPLMVNATSMLLDAGFMTIRDGEMQLVEDGNKDVFAEMGTVEGRTARRIDEVLGDDKFRIKTSTDMSTGNYYVMPVIFSASSVDSTRLEPNGVKVFQSSVNELITGEWRYMPCNLSGQNHPVMITLTAPTPPHPSVSVDMTIGEVVYDFP